MSLKVSFRLARNEHRSSGKQEYKFTADLHSLSGARSHMLWPIPGKSPAFVGRRIMPIDAVLPWAKPLPTRSSEI